VSTGASANTAFWITGSRRSSGRSVRTRATASRTSSRASCGGFSSWKLTVRWAVLSTSVVSMCLTPCTVASAFSILRATSVSSCAGEAPGSDAVIVTAGSVMSGKACTFSAAKPMSPAIVSSTKSRMPGVGLRIDQDETL
jgi:hypothetical protein